MYGKWWCIYNVPHDVGFTIISRSIMLWVRGRPQTSAVRWYDNWHGAIACLSPTQNSCFSFIKCCPIFLSVSWNFIYIVLSLNSFQICKSECFCTFFNSLIRALTFLTLAWSLLSGVLWENWNKGNARAGWCSGGWSVFRKCLVVKLMVLLLYCNQASCKFCKCLCCSAILF